MLKGSDIIGKPIIDYQNGKKIGRVIDLVFDQDRNYLLALLVQEKGFLSDAQVLPMVSIQSIGLDVVITGRLENIVSAKSDERLTEILNHNNIMKGTNIVTVSGQDLGKMVDLYFDESTGEIEGYEVSGGMFADAYSGRSFVPALQTLRIGEDYAFVPAIVAEMMEEQVGGMRGVAEKAGEQISEVTRQATHQIANAIVDPDTQQQFVIGRSTTKEVLLPDGTVFMGAAQIVRASDAAAARSQGILDRLYRATGGDLADDAVQTATAIGQDVSERASLMAQNIASKAQSATEDAVQTATAIGQDVSERASLATKNITNKAQTAAAAYTVDRALGRRVNSIVRTRNGLVIAAPGQIVTEKTIERAHTYQREEALLKSVGLSMTNAARASVDDALGTATEKISGTADRVQSSAEKLVDWVKFKADRLRTQASDTLEEQQIKGALGRPTTRVILDRRDNVILNAGELITHQAISISRREGLLDVLLASVYTKTPELSPAELRAPDSGRASLSTIN